MADHMAKINFALDSIPTYNGDPNKLNNFINCVNTVLNLFITFNPPLDDFYRTIIFLNIKNKITDKALDTIKDLELNNWDELKLALVNNFNDIINASIIIMDILKIQNIKNPYKLLEVTKEKFLSFKSRICIEESDPGTIIVITRFAEKLIINNFISTVIDPYKNNLETRNPKTLTDLEEILKNDYQYLKYNFNNTVIPPQNFPGQNFPIGPIQFQNNIPERVFVPHMQIKNAQGIKPTPMSIQTRQHFNETNNHFIQQTNGTHTPNYIVELHNIENHDILICETDQELYDEVEQEYESKENIVENTDTEDDSF